MISGLCEPQFERVEKVFRKNFLKGWEQEGAGFAVWHNGRLVVDLKGGYADKASIVEWNDQTRTVIFSVSKAIGALAIAMLVDRGHIRYEDKIAKHWPEFAQNGKHEITLEWVMTHKAGLAAIDTPITLEDARDHYKMAAIIEVQRPNWEPGTKTGYHPMTYGWLVDQIVRRVDPDGRGISKFVREDISNKHGLDFHLGDLPHSEEYTISRLAAPSLSFKFREMIHNPLIPIVMGYLTVRSKLAQLPRKVLANPQWLKVGAQCSFNHPQVRRLEQVGALGLGKAGDLAKMFGLMLQGEFVNEKMLEKFKEPQLSDIDVVVGLPISKGYGFMYEKHPRKQGKWLYGHPGFGGSVVMIEPEEKLVIAYINNGLKSGMGELNRSYRLLRNAALDSV